jgi:tripartite-type tricarboxylate transporter receptor subunit TctC
MVLNVTTLVTLLACVGLGLATPVRAQSEGPYPSRPVRLIVAFPPGGGADLTARLVAQRMSEGMGQPVVVENRPGANGVVGSEAVAKATPDGYTLLLVDRGALGINPSLYAKLPYDPVRDFAYVGIATEAPYVLVASTRTTVASVSDLVAEARAHPGVLNYASFGNGSMPQLNMEAFSRNARVQLQHVPYKGAAQAVNAVVAGEVDVALVSPPSALAFLREGRVRALAVGAPRRVALMPDVPTMAEAGAAADVLLPTWFGLAAPAGTPPDVIARLNAELKRALAPAETVERLAAAGLLPVGGSADAMATSVRQDVARFADIVRAIGLKPE